MDVVIFTNTVWSTCSHAAITLRLSLVLYLLLNSLPLIPWGQDIGWDWGGGGGLVPLLKSRWLLWMKEMKDEV